MYLVTTFIHGIEPVDSWDIFFSKISLEGKSIRLHGSGVCVRKGEKQGAEGTFWDQVPAFDDGGCTVEIVMVSWFSRLRVFLEIDFDFTDVSIRSKAIGSEGVWRCSFQWVWRCSVLHHYRHYDIYWYCNCYRWKCCRYCNPRDWPRHRLQAAWKKYQRCV